MAAAAAIATIMQVKSSEDEAQAKFEASHENARINRINAEFALEQSADQERQQRVSAAQQIGLMNANYGAAGVTKSGSVLDVLQSSAANAEKDALNIRHAGQLRSWGFLQGANLDTMAANNARTAGNYGAASAILNGASRLSQYYDRPSRTSSKDENTSDFGGGD